MNGNATEGDLSELTALVRSDQSGMVTSQITSLLDGKKTEESHSGLDWDALATRILMADKMKTGDEKQNGIIRKFPWWRLTAAAAVLIAIIGTLYFVLNGKNEAPALISQAERFKNDIQPGHNGAVLTLSNGQKIMLDSAGNGELANDRKMHVVKKDGEIAYEGKTDEIVYNTISTAKGRQWQITLSDGSKVWLNAASSIKYPVAFIGNERPVEITGEAYFEVAKDISKPFIVKTGGQEVQVLGTHFNVNAYADEGSVKTTLLEGSVAVKKGSQSVIIKPGEQTGESKTGELAIVHNVDLLEAMAWKDGLFRFKEITIESLMKQIARWYDVDVSYEGGDIKQHFIATIPRNSTAADVFKALELTGGVHFIIEGKKVIVMP
jgi:hypothetical protein